MRRLAVLGCGWLGLPLAQSLVEKGFEVHGSTTTASKIPLLEKAGITAFQITLNNEAVAGPIGAFLENAAVLIIDIPPRLRSGAGEDFVGKIKKLIPYIEASSVKKLLLVSSTSVFGDDLHWADEKTVAQPNTPNGVQLRAVEMLLQHNPNFQTTVLRLGGLIGADRHPIYSLAGRKGIENPNAPVNLIHQKDGIGLIEAIIDKNQWGAVFHGVAPEHPSRQKYYTQKASSLGLPLPEFDESAPSKEKIISGAHTQAVLGYQFKETID